MNQTHMTSNGLHSIEAALSKQKFGSLGLSVILQEITGAERVYWYKKN